MFLPPPTVATTGKSHFALRLRLCRAFFIERVTKSFFVVHFLEGARSKNAQQITCLPNDVGIFLLFFLLFAERGCTEMFDFVLPSATARMAACSGRIFLTFFLMFDVRGRMAM
jgi:hypothetical protein